MLDRVCQNCGKPIAEDMRFCPACGKEISSGLCRNCGAKLIEGARFCQKCGVPTTPEVSPAPEPPILCPKCGKENPTTNKFCQKCGTSLASAPLSQSIIGKHLVPDMDVNKKEKSRLKRKSIISTSMGIALALIAIIMFVVFARSGVPEDMLGTGGGGQTMVQTTTTGTPTTTGKTTAPTTTETGKALNDLLSLSANVGSIKYDMSTSGTSIPTTTTTVWAKNNRKRMEMTQQGMNIVMLIDTSARTMYTFMPAQNLAMKIPFDSAQVPNSPADDTASIQDSNARIISTETIDGKVCAVVEFTSGQVSGRMWIWQEKGLPIRVEAGGITVEYKNLDFADIPDSMFELPAGVTIM